MKSVIIFFSISCIFYTVILIVMYLFQEKFLFFPDQRPFGQCPEMLNRNVISRQAGDVRFYSKEIENSDRWVIIFHGNAGNACDRTYLFDLLKDTKSNIAILEYPGYGNDLNKPSQRLILEHAFKLVKHIKTMDPKSLPIYLLGESLGTGVATFVASTAEVSGLILISAYTSISDVAQHHYPWLPVKYLIKHSFNATLWARNTKIPALLFHGVNDDIIPIEVARQQLDNFSGQKNLIEISDGGHNDIVDVGGNILHENIKVLIKRKQIAK